MEKEYDKITEMKKILVVLLPCCSLKRINNSWFSHPLAMVFVRILLIGNLIFTKRYGLILRLQKLGHGTEKEAKHHV